MPYSIKSTTHRQSLCHLSHTLKEETLTEETFAISRFLAKFAKVCSREIFVIYESRKFILAKKEF